MFKVKFEQEHGQTDGRKCPKYLWWWWRSWYYVTGSRRQELEAAELSWITPAVIGLLRQVIYELIPSWTFRIAHLKTRWHHWRHKRSHVPFFRCLFDRLPVRISISNLYHQTLRKRRPDQSLWFWSAVSWMKSSFGTTWVINEPSVYQWGKDWQRFPCFPEHLLHNQEKVWPLYLRNAACSRSIHCLCILPSRCLKVHILERTKTSPRHGEMRSRRHLGFPPTWQAPSEARLGNRCLSHSGTAQIEGTSLKRKEKAE